MKNSENNQNLFNRKQNVLEIKSDALKYISTGVLSNELEERIKKLEAQIPNLSKHEAIEILLDYTEREVKEIDLLIKANSSPSILSAFISLLNVFTKR